MSNLYWIKDCPYCKQENCVKVNYKEKDIAFHCKNKECKQLYFGEVSSLVKICK